MAGLAANEIVALAKLLDELDYYQLLHLERGADAGQVRRAYHATARSFHPDAHRHLDPELRGAVQRIAKRVTEAYAVLRDARRRPAYDQHLTGGGVRLQLAEAVAQTQRREQEQREGRTSQGRQFFGLAQAALAREDFGGAARNLQTALTFEPDNAAFKELLASVRKQRR